MVSIRLASLDHNGVVVELVGDLVSVGRSEAAKLDIELPANDASRQPG